MASFVKLSPINASTGTIRVSVKAINNFVPVLNDNAYIWFEENRGGNGLEFRGRISRVHSDQEFEVADLVAVHFPLRNEDLRPLRDTPDSHPLSSLSSKLYKYSHNGSREIDAAEAQFLDTRF